MCIYILKVFQLGVVGGVVGDSSLLEVGVDVEEDVAGDSDKVDGVGHSEAGEEEEDEVRTLLCYYSVRANVYHVLIRFYMFMYVCMYVCVCVCVCPEGHAHSYI